MAIKSIIKSIENKIQIPTKKIWSSTFTNFHQSIYAFKICYNALFELHKVLDFKYFVSYIRPNSTKSVKAQEVIFFVI